jgi:hypothetical protein
MNVCFCGNSTNLFFSENKSVHHGQQKTLIGEKGDLQNFIVHHSKRSEQLTDILIAAHQKISKK